jgi:hypothetical protein
MADREFDVVGELQEDGVTLLLKHGKAFKRLTAKLVGQPLRVRFSVLRKKRSDAQNRYMWGVIVPTVAAWLRETQGEKYDKDDVYYWINGKVLGRQVKIKEIAGEEIAVMQGKRFSQMTTVEFNDAVEQILQYFAEMGLVIPEPRQHNFLHEFLEDN